MHDGIRHKTQGFAYYLLAVSWGPHMQAYRNILSNKLFSSFKGQILKNEIPSFGSNMIFNKQFMCIYVLLEPTRVF